MRSRMSFRKDACCAGPELSPGAGTAGYQVAAGLVGGASRHRADARVQAELLPGAQHGHPWSVGRDTSVPRDPC